MAEVVSQRETVGARDAARHARQNAPRCYGATIMSVTPARKRDPRGHEPAMHAPSQPRDSATPNLIQPQPRARAVIDRRRIVKARRRAEAPTPS